MPTYEYECDKCGAVFELFQPITEPPRRRLRKTDPKPCSCNAPVTRRIGAGAGIIFKGSGFYQTDYRSESYKQAAEAEKEGANGKAKKDDAGKKNEKPAKQETKAVKSEA
jgi:putative FmdB family regulatory protein